MKLVVGMMLVVGLTLLLRAASTGADAPAVKTGLSHDVFFTLKESTPAGRTKLVDACKKYLSDHPGTVSFSAGVLAEDLTRDVNDRDFDVALHIVFKDKAAHDKYQDADSHQKFIAENKDTWKKVRVFDSVVEFGGK